MKTIFAALWMLLSVGADPAFAKVKTTRSFTLGICVGQSLSDQGITVPVPERGRPVQWDESLRKAMRDALDTCQANFRMPPKEGTDTSTSVSTSVLTGTSTDVSTATSTEATTATGVGAD